MASLLLLVLLTADSSATLDALAEPGAIDRACDAAEKYAMKHKIEGRLVAEVSDAVLPKKNQGSWKVVKNGTEMKGAAAEHAPNTQARIWVAPGGVTFVDMFFQSDSGDWAHFVDYCYRADGTLARTLSTLNTFYAVDPANEDAADGISRVRTRHYDVNGKILRSKQRLLNLHTKKPSPKASFQDESEPPYLKRDDLPFWTTVKDALSHR